MSAASTPRNFTDATVTLNDDAAHASVVPLLIGSVKWSGLVPAGREGEVYQTQGVTTGARLGARVYPEVTIEAQVARLDDAAYEQAMGVLSGFISTTADIGDQKANDLEIDESYSTDTRLSTWDDAILTSWEYTAGSPGQISMTFQVLGPVVIDGTTYIAAR